jgi:hypothetical protein
MHKVDMLSVANKPYMMIVIMLNAVMQSVVKPLFYPSFYPSVAISICVTLSQESFHTHRQTLFLCFKLTLCIMTLSTQSCYAECRKQALYADCHYAECHYAECHSTITLSLF